MCAFHRRFTIHSAESGSTQSNCNAQVISSRCCTHRTVQLDTCEMQLTLFPAAANDERFGTAQRERTVPIPETITPIPGYPDKLVVFKMAASQYWQVRCWYQGKTHRRSTKSQSLRVAQKFAKRFYEWLLVESRQLSQEPLFGVVLNDTSKAGATIQLHSFGVMAAKMFSSEQARVKRGEFSRDSLLVLRNRLDKYLLPRWGATPIEQIDYKELMKFVDFMSLHSSTTTISQYLVVVRKVLHQSVREGALEKLPEFPKVKVKSASRGAFTPTEYWRILRTARSLRGKPHPGNKQDLRKHHRIVYEDCCMPPDLAWAVGFMVNSFIRPSDIRTLKHKHVEIVTAKHTYLRLTLPETKKHDAPIVTLFPAVRIYREILKYQKLRGKASPNDYLFMPDRKDRKYALSMLSVMFNWVLSLLDFKKNAHGQDRSLYSLRHSAITFRLLYGQGIDLLTLARNARTSVDVIHNHYASTVNGEQNIALLQSRRSRTTNSP